MRNETIEVVEVVVVEPQRPEFLHVLESSSLDDLQVVSGHVEHVQTSRNLGKGLIGQLGKLVSGEAEAVQIIESSKGTIFDDFDLVVCQIKHLQLLTFSDEGGNGRQKIFLNKKFNEIFAFEGDVGQVLDLVVVQPQQRQLRQRHHHRRQLVVGQIENLKVNQT